MQVRSVGLVSRLLYTRHGGCVCAVQGLYVVYSFLDGNSKDAIPINLQDRGTLKLCTVGHVETVYCSKTARLLHLTQKMDS